VYKRQEKIYTVPEIAQYLKMSKSKVYDLVKKKKIPFIKIGRNVRIRQSDFDEWLEEMTQP
jgi:putative molybdopterin biosynthesis protein